MTKIARELARFALETGWDDLPASVVKETKLILMDSIGCALGASTTDKGKMSIALARRLGGPTESSIIGTGGKVSRTNAAFANGELILTLDFSNIIAGGHDGAYIIPTLLAVGESVGASGKDLIAATAVGLEISARLARAVGRHNFTPEAVRRQRAAGPGLTGNAYSTFGAAAGAARLLGLDADKTLHALGIAGHLCMALSYGRWSFSEQGHMTKYGVPGWQGTGAVTAAMLAEMGYTGDIGVLDSAERGFGYFLGYKSWYPEEITEGLGRNWSFPIKLHYKPYPCCGVFHGPLDCFTDIIETNDLKPEEIEKVTAYCRGHMNSPLFLKKQVDGISDAQFNPGHVFGAAAHRVPRGVEWYDNATMNDPRIRSFGDKVTCVNHPGYGPALEQDRLSALSKVEVVARGQTFATETRYRRGSAGTEAMLSDAELAQKFRHNAARTLTKDKTQRAIDALMGLDKVDTVLRLMDDVSW